MEALVGAAMASGTVVPVVIVAAAAGALVSWRTPTRAIVVIFYTAFPILLGLVGRNDRWHEGGLLAHSVE
jgi:hypothetical protein